MSFPEFALKHLPEVLGLPYEAKRTTLGLGRGSLGANTPQQDRIRATRITDWARATGRCLEAEAFAQSLDGSQVESELAATFRETPEFGRSLALRLADYHEESSHGHLTLIGGGGEAVVFFDPENQRVLKLLSPAGRAHFGWLIDRDNNGQLSLRASTLPEALCRYWLAEQAFPTGLDIEAIGTDGSFLVLSQPFLLGTNPTENELAQWMGAHGWEKTAPPTNLETLANLTWQKQGYLATDVRPENVIRAEADGELYPFDFILAEK